MNCVVKYTERNWDPDEILVKLRIVVLNARNVTGTLIKFWLNNTIIHNVVIFILARHTTHTYYTYTAHMKKVVHTNEYVLCTPVKIFTGKISMIL
jgi:hypothetical protein